MTSAVLPSRRDEPRWTEPTVFMKKHPPFNPNPNPNPNPSFPSTNHTSTAGVSSDGHVTIRVAQYSPSELRELKRRLVAELEQVRSLLSKIESRSGVGSSNPNPANPNSARLALKKCTQILNRLMKHKKQFWFNTPVDVVGMNLHDYYTIVKQPMDLGTVKSRLSKDWYRSPEDFASDVRLTFNNAILYNPKGHVVHELALELLNLFEKLFNPVYESYKSPPVVSAPVVTPPVVTPPVAKRPKPKARDLNKRLMTYEEKQRLSEGLQNLPEEKMMQVVGIVRKRNLDTTQDGDEIELDIDTMDNETLWELDRFVSNCKKSMWKHRRREGEGETLGVANHVSADVAPDVVAPGDDVVAAPMIESFSGEPDEPGPPVPDNKGEMAEEDVDIGEEMPAVSYPPVSLEIQKEPAQESSSSGSSSSSSDSDSSSSSSGSDQSGTQSPAVGSRSSPKVDLS